MLVFAFSPYPFINPKISYKIFFSLILECLKNILMLWQWSSIFEALALSRPCSLC